MNTEEIEKLRLENNLRLERAEIPLEEWCRENERLIVLAEQEFLRKIDEFHNISGKGGDEHARDKTA